MPLILSKVQFLYPSKTMKQRTKKTSFFEKLAFFNQIGNFLDLQCTLLYFKFGVLCVFLSFFFLFLSLKKTTYIYITNMA